MSSPPAELIASWGLAVEGPLAGGLAARVFACTDAAGTPLVLKLSPPWAAPELEATALSLWNGRGAPRLVDFEAEAGALLIERILPGTPLAPGRDEEAIPAVARLVERLHVAPPPGFRRLEEELVAYFGRKQPFREHAGELFDVAFSSGRGLCADEIRPALLHGDVMDKNLLLGPRGLVAIDPMPAAGDPHSDLGFFAATHPPAVGLVRRAEELARRLGLDPGRAARWAAVYAVGEACEGQPEHALDLRAWIRAAEAGPLLSAG